MTASSTLPAPNLMPLMRYRDLAEAMGWLEQAFGFEKQIAVSDSEGAIIYGQMTYRGSLMMMGAVRDTDLDKLMRQPDEVGGVETQSCYLVVDDADAHYARAREAGAEVVLELKSDGLGRRGYSCRDPEGHIWNFGTYNPGKGLTIAGATAEDADERGLFRRSPRMLMSIAGLILALGAAAWWLGGDVPRSIADLSGHKAAQEAEKAYAELVKVRAEKRKADEIAKGTQEALEAERARRLALESSSGYAAEQLAHEERARRAAEETVAALREELKRKQDALEAAVEAKRVSEEKLAVKSAAAEPPPPSTERPSGNGVAATASGTSGIETSATRPASTPQSFRPEDDDDDDNDDNDDDEVERRAPRSTLADRPRQSRPSSRMARRNKLPVIRTLKRKYPLYVTDVTHVWPYVHWSK